MRGVTFLGDRALEIGAFPDPTPGPGEVVLEIKASGMCGSDLKFYRAPRGVGARDLGLGGGGEPVIAGHEPCGVVAAVGPGVGAAEAAPGQRVMVHHYAGCGVCGHCRTGWSQLCRAGIVVYGITAHGAHAPHMAVPARTLVPLSDGLSFEVGAAISCARSPRNVTPRIPSPPNGSARRPFDSQYSRIPADNSPSRAANHPIETTVCACERFGRAVVSNQLVR